MKKLTLGLRAKILWGALILLVPLVVSLAFLYNYGYARIHASVVEKEGLAVTSPLLDVLFAWQSMGVDKAPSEELTKALETFVQRSQGTATDLHYNAADQKSDDIEWLGPEGLTALVKDGAGGDYDKFSSVHDRLAVELTFLSDNSGLVLDPDLDSYDLVLALYESAPRLLDGLTILREYTRPEKTTLTLGERLSLFALAREIHLTTTKLVEQVSKSVKEAGQTKSMPATYGATMQETIDPLTATAVEIRNAALQAAQNPKFEPLALDARLDKLVPLINAFHDQGVTILGDMIGHRIDRDTAELIAAFTIAAAGLAFSLFVLLLVVTGIRRRTRLLIGSLGGVAQGDLSHEVPSTLLASRDELGELARSVQVLQEDLRKQVVSLATVTDRLSQMGSTLAANTEESAAAIEEMSATSKQVARFATGQLGQTTTAGAEISDMLSRVIESNDLTQGMATQFFMFSQSMEANRRRIGATAAEARTTGDLAVNLMATGKEGEHSLESLRQSIGGVVRKTQEIQEIVRFILDIADRTNLLSMNAAIEAAHAGTSGRGFAVVADEIRKLADTSSKQAQSIKALVDSIAEVANQTVGKSDATGESFKKLLKDIEAVRHASQAIAAQVVQQETEDGKLSDGLMEFTRFYSQLSDSMDHQVNQSGTVQKAVTTLAESAQQISQSMEEQKIGMEQATDAVLQVRDASMILGQIMVDLTDLMGRFKT